MDNPKPTLGDELRAVDDQLGYYDEFDDELERLRRWADEHGEDPLLLEAEWRGEA